MYRYLEIDEAVAGRPASGEEAVVGILRKMRCSGGGVVKREAASGGERQKSRSRESTQRHHDYASRDIYNTVPREWLRASELLETIHV